jgi:molybdopterin molybdotransferase
MLTPAEAEAAITAAVQPVSAEALPLARCAGRVLRAPVAAERDAPPFDRVAMDGIAIAASPTRRRWRIAGTQPAGVPALSLADPGDCFEVMTGAILPRGCDTVMPVEQLRLSEGTAALPEDAAVDPGQHVHRRASDARQGDELLAAGTRLGPPELAIAASTGQAELRVSRAPRVGIVTTGDELVEPGLPVLEHQVRRSNAYGIAASLALAGFAATSDRQLPDREDRMRDAFLAALGEHDVLVLSGGVSAGRFDFVPSVLASLGVRERFHGIAQRPGRPMWFGVAPSGALVFALPGNPVSVLVCLARYVIPALRRLVGEAVPAPPQAALARDVAFNKPLACFMPVVLGYDGQGRMLAEPRPTAGSGDFIALAGTDGFVELPPGPPAPAAGLCVPFYRW